MKNAQAQLEKVMGVGGSYIYLFRNIGIKIIK